MCELFSLNVVYILKCYRSIDILLWSEITKVKCSTAPVVLTVPANQD